MLEMETCCKEKGGRSEKERENKEELPKMIVSFFFFFKQKTAYEIKECDWSSDVCSSDLVSIRALMSSGLL